MILTRIGEGSRLVLTGDLMQSDLGPSVLNGLSDFHRRWRRSHIEHIRCIEFEGADVLRSAAVASVLEMYASPVGGSGSTDAALIPLEFENKWSI